MTRLCLWLAAESGTTMLRAVLAARVIALAALAMYGWIAVPQFLAGAF